ncbi:MAG: glycogen/starch/alpha-glucan phosphorylase [Verrucomicrobia bacterium]|nr:glycogen/starch/alpha-glucan phosphorylase [Verrucomicrobiota bacterium]
MSTTPPVSVSTLPLEIDPDPSVQRACLLALRLALGKEPRNASAYDKYQSLALAMRARLMDDWLETEKRYHAGDVKKVHYLSLEFLMGRTLQNAILNLDLEDDARSVMREMAMVLEDVYEEEHDAGLGNGGLGRLAACFLDSLATLGIPACGHGIRYEYGIFNQVIQDGRQVEKPDYWLFRGNPWETARPEQICRVRFYGRTRACTDSNGCFRVEWTDTENILAMPYEILVPGFRNRTVNPLILWAAKSTEEFNLEYFNHGDYMRAVQQKDSSETISKVLYPNDAMSSGKELRLKQQYFFVAASLQKIIREFLDQHAGFESFPDKVAVHLNDTHPAVAIPELMRILLDEHGFTWEKAWAITIRTFAYTNHTIMPEALERWNVELFGRLLPRHLEIIYEINRRFLDEVAARFPCDVQRLRQMSIIEEDGGRKIRMAYLAIVGSHSVNGVAALHSDLLKRETFRSFYELWPERFNNKTNGVTQRRWLFQANPSLSRLINDTIGTGWLTNLDELRKLEACADDSNFRETWEDLKFGNKVVLSAFIANNLGIDVDPQSMFDVQVKRIHEYKRQLLNILRVVAVYLRVKDAPNGSHVPRTVILGGKAAPGYFMAKLIIRLANDAARIINADPQTSRFLKLVFLPNYRVSLAERIFPASNLSEQISTAGTEASGTGNMKFALNGALTIGTLDGANIEIRDAVGAENIFIFGLTETEVTARKAAGYVPMDIYHANAGIKRVLDLIGSGFFSAEEPSRYMPLVDSLLSGGDRYMLLADFDSYLAVQEQADACFRDEREWTRRSILNVARMGFFSSDRTIRQYAREIWNTPPVA